MDFAQVAALVIFVAVVCGVIGLVLYPASFKIPYTSVLIPTNYSIIPLLGAVLLLICGSLDGPGLARGIVGNEDLQPYSIVILFMALAYISSSLDSTGVFAWLALHITRVSHGRGLLLFCSYFALSSIVTIVTSNDIVIMTLTPIVLYFSAATGTDPIPFLTAEFTAANIWSMALFIGNPTNIIVADAYNMTFLGYSKWMVLPTIGAGLTCLAVLLLCHYRHIPAQLAIPDIPPSTMLSDKAGAILGTINVLVCLGLLAAAPTLGWPLWAITLVCAALHAIYNFLAYVVLPAWRKKGAPAAAAAGCGDVGLPTAETTEAAAAAAAVSGQSKVLADMTLQTTDLRHSDSLTKVPGLSGALLAGSLETEMSHNSATAEQRQSDRDLQQRQQQSMAYVQHHDAFVKQGQVQQQHQQWYVHTDTQYQCMQQQPPCYPLQRQQQQEEEQRQHHHQWQQQQLQLQQQHQQQQQQQHQHQQRYQQQLQKQQQQRVVALGGAVPSLGPPHGGLDSVQEGSTSSVVRGPCGIQLDLQPPAAAAGPYTAALVQSSLSLEAAAAYKPDAAIPGSLLPVQAPPAAAAAGAASPPGSSAAAAAPLLQVREPGFFAGFVQLPWEVVPFVLGMFILVEGLAGMGWLDLLGRGLGYLVNLHLALAFAVMGAVSIVLANIMNNQPMTILMTRVMMSQGFLQAVSSVKHQQAASFAVVVGSNLGANFTLIGALAGIMWVSILKRQGTEGVTYLRFMRLMSPSGVCCTVVSLVVLYAEFWGFGGP